MLRAINCRTPFLSKVCRSTTIVKIAKNMLPYTSREFDKTKDIILLRLAVCPTSPPNIFGNIDQDNQSTSLAGEPRSILSDREEIRAEVLAKWNQRPKLDKEKEWIKYSIHY